MLKPESIENRWDILYRDYPEVYESFAATPYRPPVIDEVARIIDLRARCIADVGAGTGRSSRALARFARQVIGVEREAGMIRVAAGQSNNARAEGANPVSYLCGDALALPLAANSVDLVTGITLALYPPDQYRVYIREGLRVARGALLYLGIAPGWYGGELHELIKDVEMVDEAVDRIFRVEFNFAYQDILTEQDYGTPEHMIGTYGFIFGKKAIEHIKEHQITTIRWKFRLYWRSSITRPGQ